MPEIILNCPHCQRQLRVPENLLGRRVKCPSCDTAFTAEELERGLPVAPLSQEHGGATPAPGKSPELAEDEYEEATYEPPSRRRAARDAYYDDYEDDYEDWPVSRTGHRLRRDYAPHRGGVILTLGILSFFCIPIILGPIAWVMGQGDMREIREGRMDPEGEGITNAGRICGMIATIIAIVGCTLYGIIIMIAAMSGGLR